MDKKILTAEEIMNAAEEMGYDVTLEACEEAAEQLNSAEPAEVIVEDAELGEDDLENVVGGASTTTILSWLRKMNKKRPMKRLTLGRLDAWEIALSFAATRKFGRKAAAVSTAYFLCC